MGFTDLTGQKFGRLTVIEFAYKSKRNFFFWKCKCDCGNEKIVRADGLRSGHAKSCGCFKRDTTKNLNRSHGFYGTYIYHTWGQMIQRCTNPNSKYFFRYGMRGIEVCERWLHSFENFYEDMGERPTPKHTLDRKDNDGNYCKENCRWATRREQSGNISTNRWIEYGNEKMILSDWARKFNVKSSYLTAYLRTHSVEETIQHYTNFKQNNHGITT